MWIRPFAAAALFALAAVPVRAAGPSACSLAVDSAQARYLTAK
jgi:hypothetical protein